MKSAEFFLFRSKLAKPAQAQLFPLNLDRHEILKLALESSAVEESKKGHFWLAGRPNFVEPFAGYFSIGKRKKTIKGEYVPSERDFVDIEDTEVPHTRVLFDLQLGVFAFQKNYHLTSKPELIASAFTRLMHRTSIFYENNLLLRLDQINDPVNLLIDIQKALRIFRFKFTFTRPNPFDVERFLNRPLEEFAEATNADEGSTEVLGNDLEKGPLEDVVRSVASVGNNIEVRFQPPTGGRAITKKLKGNPCVLPVESNVKPEEALYQLRARYAGVRGKRE